MPRVIEATPLAGARLSLQFEDGVTGEVDLSDLVGVGVFAPLADPTHFATVSIGDDGEVRWGEDLDLCPDALYLRVTGKSVAEVFGPQALEKADAGR